MTRPDKHAYSEERDEIDELYRRISVMAAQLAVVEDRLDSRDWSGPWQEPEWINGYAQITPPYEPFTFRVYTSRFPEFKGHIDVSGATSGDPAFVLPLEDEVDGHAVILPYDMFDHIIITEDGGTTFIHALVKIDSTTNEFSLTWPAS